jgi:hypothetical protein
MLQVVRLQHKTSGVGIFRCGLFNEEYINMTDEEKCMYDDFNLRHRNFPTPSTEGLSMYRNDRKWFCAYKTVEQLQQWLMPNEIRFLISKDFDVLLLTVNEYQVGEHQVVFTRESVQESTVINSLFI